MNFVSSHPAFNDTIDSLRNEFKDDKSNNVIICGAHDFSRTQSIDLYKKKFDKVIVFNQEPLTATQRQFMHKGYYAWLKQADEVCDYDEQKCIEQGIIEFKTEEEYNKIFYPMRKVNV